VNDILAQLRQEWVHIALVALLYGIVRPFKRDLRRGETLATERDRNIDSELKEQRKELDSHSRQIRDTRSAVGCCETALKIEHWKYTD
jgi:hypothetical protein